jgi:hypothetical protein
VYELVTEQGVWRIGTNQELRELCKSPCLVTFRKEWLGHVIRMYQRRLDNIIFESKSESRRTVRKPRQILLEDVEDDLWEL